MTPNDATTPWEAFWARMKGYYLPINDDKGLLSPIIRRIHRLSKISLFRLRMSRTNEVTLSLQQGYVSLTGSRLSPSYERR